MTPLLRWAGGKRWLVPQLGAIADMWNPTSYAEPFVGGGALFFAFDWPNPTINDLNEELMAMYRGVARDHEAVRRRLRSLRVDRIEFDRVRNWRPRRDEWRAARLLYLNRCSYGGIYRTDRHGMFNVPFSGDRSTGSLLKDGRLEAAAVALRAASISSGDFEPILERASEGAFVYCDPAYALPGSEQSFRRYSAPVFTWSDQKRLADAAHEVRRKGALVLVSNAPDPRVDVLYKEAVSLQFKRRAPLPNAQGVPVVESFHILAERALVRALHRQINRSFYDQF